MSAENVYLFLKKSNKVNNISLILCGRKIKFVVYYNKFVDKL